MEDGNALDLTLSLPCGGPSGALKGKTATGSEVRVEETDRSTKLIDDFKNFLDGSNHKEDSQRVNQSKPDEKIFYDLSKGPTNVEAGNKRKSNVFDETNNQKRHERDNAYLATMHIKPHVSIPADDGSTAENEDVADSEADVSKLPPKEVRVSESTGVDLQSQRGFTISSEKGHVMSVSHGVPYSGQSGNVIPYSFPVKESNSIPGGQQPVIPANMPLMFSYTTVQSATASASGKSEGHVSDSLQQHYPSYFNRGPPNPNTNKQNDGVKITQATIPVNAPNPFDRAKDDSKKAKEEGTSMHTEPVTKGINVIDQSKPEAFPPEHPAIRPGIAAELKFGGSGSSPNLPWVSTTGPGPNGKTISGVTYRYSGTQIRIVCACHGSHMSPEEFVQHASEEHQQPNLNGGPAGLPSFSNSNPAASAQN